MPDHTPEPPPALAQLAANVLALRARGNWSSNALAEQSQVSRLMVQMLEKGQTNVSLRTLDKLARALGVSTGSLLGKKPVARQDGEALIEEVLARNLLAARRRLALTQDQLAERAGLHRPVIAYIENQSRNPSMVTLAKLADAAGVSLEALLSS